MKITSFAWGNIAAKILVGLVLCFAVYDVYAPIYSNVLINNAARTSSGITADVKFQKDRNCQPVTETVSAFLHMPDGYRIWVPILDSSGNEMKLRNFPPSDKPTTLRHTWSTDAYLSPDSISLSFDLRCYTNIRRTITWTGKVSLPPATRR